MLESSLQSDHGREFSSNLLKKFLENKRIIQRFSVPYTPEQMGTVERIAILLRLENCY